MAAENHIAAFQVVTPCSLVVCKNSSENHAVFNSNAIFIIIIIIIMSVMESGHLLTRSGLTYLEVSSEVCRDSFCQLGNCVSLSWVVRREAFLLHVVSSSSCIPAVFPEPVLFLIPLQCVKLFCNLSQVYPAVLLIYFISAAVIQLR